VASRTLAYADGLPIIVSCHKAVVRFDREALEGRHL
jgi:hypothetical protein